ncbi:MAG: hypothetical protein KF830_17140 [Planctomycetes bacterium]|nr:hypothetical protein [Planctomycetota bacterium]
MTCLVRSLCLLAAVLAARPARAQDAFAKEEADLVRQCISALGTFASVAKSNKVGQRAKQAFDLILQYDPDNSTARSELGFRKEKGTWVEQPPEKRKKWADKANFEGRFKVMDQWARTAIKLGELHRKLGLKLKEAGAERARYHLEKAVYYNAMDREANLALGYKEGPGFFGTEAQIAMAKRMKEIEMKAVEFARREYEVQELTREQMPVELQNLADNAPDWMRKPNFDIHGARTKHFTVWVRGSQNHANTSAKWAERALDFGVWLLGPEQAKQLRFVERASGAFAWYGFLATQREREELLKANPNIWQREGSIERAKDFANNIWRAKEGGAVAMVRSSPREVQDSLVGYVFMQGLVQSGNEGFGQGIIHAATWYMKSTAIVRWGARPEGTGTDDSLDLPEGANWWMRAVRDQAVSNQDWPAAQVPREKLSRFRNDCRLKAWSFTTWVWAAYPDKWLEFYLKLPDEKIPTLEQVDEVAKAAFGKSMDELDTEWREWARGDSGVAFATGYGPPLLPERPSTIELAALEQINLIRAQPIGYTWESGKGITDGTWVPLGECEMDAETSIGCRLHAAYVANHPELVEDPTLGIHEQNPAHPDFTRQGQQAGSGNIVTSTGRATERFARDSVDGWMSAPYHRFPMLGHNIKRLGYAHVDNNSLSVSVLDMGSLMEPYDPSTAPRLVAWPAPNMNNVPTHFGDPEWPNPLQHQPEGQQDVTKCGYVVSLQLQNEIAKTLAESGIELWEARKGGRQPAKNFVAPGGADFRAWAERAKKQVDCFVHTPQVPLNKERDQRDVLFCIPKQPLEANKTYQVRCLLHIGSADPHVFIWEFSTGAQREGLKLK